MTVFDTAEITVYIGDDEYTSDKIEYIRVTRAVSGLPVSGIISAMLSVRLRTDRIYNCGESVRVLYNRMKILPEFFINDPAYSGGVFTVTAYDRCRKTDLPFGADGYFERDKSYSVGEILQKITAVCGFAGYDLPNVSTADIPYKFIKDSTCRELLQIISENNCCVWYCSNDDRLRYNRFGEHTAVYEIAESDSTALCEGAAKGAVSCVCAENKLNGDVIVLGSGDFRNTLRISGKMLDESTVSAIATAVSDKVYRAFSVQCVKTSVHPEAFSAFDYGLRVYNAMNIVTEIRPSGFYSRVSAPVICEDETDYIGFMSYCVRERIMREKIYGSTVIGADGLTMIYREGG